MAAGVMGDDVGNCKMCSITGWCDVTYCGE